MKKSGIASTVFYYFAVLPSAVWIVMQLPYCEPLRQRISSKPLWFWAVLAVGLVVSEIARRLLHRLGRARRLSNSLAKEQRSFSVGKQWIAISLLTVLVCLAALLLGCSPFSWLALICQGAGAQILSFAGAPIEATWVQWGAASAMLLVGVIWLALPVFPRKPPKYKTYSLEMDLPWVVRIPVFSPERFTLRYLRKLIRSDYLNRFNVHTIFAGHVRCLFEGRFTNWLVSYDERIMSKQARPRTLTAEHVQRYIDALRSLEKQEHAISHSIVSEVAAEHGLADRAARGHHDEKLGDLTEEEVKRITRTLARSNFNNILTLDVADVQDDPRAKQAFAKRLEEMAEQANRSRKTNGAFELNIHRRDKKLTTRVLQFRVDPYETVRRSKMEYSEKLSPQHSLLFATVRGASGEHSEGFDADEETVDEDSPDLESVAGGASALDHIQELNPSVQQMVVEGKGFGRIYDMQLGKESYQVITEWMKSGGANPLTGWRLFRCSKVIDGDGKVVARRVQGLPELIPHLLALCGLGKERSRVKILSSSLHAQDKLPLALLALDAFEAHDFRNRRRILNTHPSADQ